MDTLCICLVFCLNYDSKSVLDCAVYPQGSSLRPYSFSLSRRIGISGKTLHIAQANELAVVAQSHGRQGHRS
jgi:hypothetical protein